MRIRTLTTATALATTLSLGAAGVAGAAGTPGHVGHHRGSRITSIAETGSLPASFSCTKANVDLGRISVAQAVLAKRLAKGQAAEAAAKAAGNTEEASALAARLAKGATYQTDLVTVASLITTKCPGSSASSPAATTVENHARHLGTELRTLVSVANAKALPASFSCTSASSDEAKLAKLTTRLDASITRGKAAEAAATAQGNTARAQHISHRLDRATTLVTDAATVRGLITAACS